MRIMAVDLGDARTGIAISDITGFLAGDAWIIEDRNMQRVADKICEEAKNRGAGTIVLGYPKNMNGTVGERGIKSEQMAETLREKSGLPVVLWDERRTTVDAHRILSEAGKKGKKKKNVLDAVAASLILESYLTFNGGK